MNALPDYLRQIEQALKAGNATEHTHRSALKTLIEAPRPNITATNEPRQIDCGSPDYIVTEKGIPLGYVEAKDVGVDLDSAEESKHLTRYRSSLRNLILTDYLEFRLYRNGEPVQQPVQLAKRQKNGVLRREPGAEKQFAALIGAFLDAEVPSIATARDLAERMARMARLLHDLIRKAFATEGQTGDLHEQYEAFKQVLIADLSVDQFADMYAQTIAYGLFAARHNHPGPGFTRERAGHDLPKTNPFLRRLFNSIAGPDLDERISWLVDDLAALLAKAEVSTILSEFGRVALREDPVIHFYETFLAAYDSKARELRGVYYTPEPVVRFIAQSAHQLIKSDFGLPAGLADASRHPTPARGEDGPHKLIILDPATGTGTFLRSVVDVIHESFRDDGGAWSGYVSEHLLPRLIGFELLMAPYAIAHLKLALTLAKTGYDLRRDERLRVYLTNTLDEPHVGAGLPLFARWLAEEAKVAGDVKKTAPVMVILGNPPYSGNSQHSGEWIKSLLRGRDSLSNSKTHSYYSCDGAPLRERQSKWLNDDYVKFMRFAQWRIENTGQGILGFVTNRNYLDNVTFRGMRQALLSTFDKVFVLDLHGDAMSGDTAPSGIKDENVFDITKGVAISIFVRTRQAGKNKRPSVSYASLRGTRGPDGGAVELNGKASKSEGKYGWLRTNSVETVKWLEVSPESPSYLFTPENGQLRQQYRKDFVGIDEIFHFGSSGFVAGYSEVAVGFTEKEVLARFEMFVSPEAVVPSHDLRAEFNLPSRDDWSIEEARTTLRADKNWKEQVVPYLARPFDIRSVMYSEAVLIRSVRRAQQHMLMGENLALLVSRQTGAPFKHVLATRSVATFNVLDNAGRHGSGPFFPLYTFTRRSDGKRRSLGIGPAREHNLSATYIEAFAACVQLKFLNSGQGNLKTDFGPEDVFAFIYAVLHSAAFRTRFDQQLRTGFPRVPLPTTKTVFQRLAKLGMSLVDLHTFQNEPRHHVPFPVPGDNVIRKVSFEVIGSEGTKGRVWINEKQHFGDVPRSTWDFQVGRYRVCARWLEERSGRKLTFDEIRTFGTIVAAVRDTCPVLEEIEGVIATNPLWSAAP